MADSTGPFRFVRDEEEDAKSIADYRVRDAMRYYQQLYREYVIIDLTHHEETKVGMRWRLEREVIDGKGETVCGATGCNERRTLESYELPFCYEEAGARKVELVKARVCKGCYVKLVKASGGQVKAKYSKQKEAPPAKRQKAVMENATN